MGMGPGGRLVAPDVEITEGQTGWRGRPEPGMAIRGVIHHQVDDDPEPRSLAVRMRTTKSPSVPNRGSTP